MDPINYNVDVASPFDAATKGYAQGIALRQAELQAQTSQQMNVDLARLSAKPNPTAQDYAAMMARYPMLSDHFKKSWDVLNADQQQAKLSQGTQVYAALQSGSPDTAVQLLTRQAQAYRNSGQDQEAQHAETMAKLIQMNPNAAKTASALSLSSLLGPEKFASTFSTLQKLPGEVAQGEAKGRQMTYEANNTPERLDLENRYKGAEIRNLDSQVATRAGQLTLDRDKLQSDVELKLYELNQKTNPALNLDDGAKKIINDSTVNAVSADQSAGQQLDLASRIQAEGMRSGATAKGAELYKKLTGNQDGITQLRQEYTRMRNSQVMKFLPPGSASDKDVAFAVQGFPDETADPTTMASFLRGMAKLSQYASATENAKAEWVNAVGHLGKPRTDINVGGVNVPAGSTFADFAKQYVAAAATKRGAEQSQATVPQRSYMRWATPGQQ